jgi:hypothetical protein
VDLVRVDLGVMLAAVETLEQLEERSGRARRAARRVHRGEDIDARIADVDARAEEDSAPLPPPRATAAPAPSTPAEPPPRRIELDPKSSEKGVARLVLTLVDFIRRLLERQAIRRMEGGLIDEAAIERMGETLSRLEEKVREMGSSFGLKPEDLDIDLGPLGRLSGPPDDIAKGHDA